MPIRYEKKCYLCLRNGLIQVAFIGRGGDCRRFALLFLGGFPGEPFFLLGTYRTIWPSDQLYDQLRRDHFGGLLALKTAP